MNLAKTVSMVRLLAGSKAILHKTPAQIQTIQEAKLRRLLRYTWVHSPYYREKWQQAGITEEMLGTVSLSQLPSITKSELLEHFDRLVTVQGVTQDALRAFDETEKPSRTPYLNQYHVVHSSGSTGKPGYFLYDEQAWNAMLVGIIRAALWDMSMLQIGMLLASKPRILFIAATDGRYGGAMAVGDGIESVGASALNLDIKTPLSEWKDQIEAFRPTMIIGYPSAIKILSGLVTEGQLSMRVSRIVSCGEPLGASLRQTMETAFHAKVINFYGASESLCLGVEGDPAEGMLLFDDMNIIEADETGLYVTCLYNFAQPLIRYRLTDQLRLEAPGESDPYPLTRAHGLLGRSEDVMWFENPQGQREFLHPLAVEGFCIEGLRDYQFLPNAKDRFDLLVETEPHADRARVHAELVWQIRQILEKTRLSFVDFHIRFVDSIQPDRRTGKKPLVLRETRWVV